jgi:hypothetical protein
MMNGQPCDDVEISIDEANEMLVGEESHGKSANNSNQCFMIENDFKGDDNQQL